MTRFAARRFVACLLIACTPTAFAAVDYWPTCSSPQPLTPVQSSGLGTYANALAWNGTDFALVGGSFQFQRFYADGTAAVPPHPLYIGGYLNYDLGLVWDGNGYALIWNVSTYPSKVVVQFMKLDANGNYASGATQVSFYGQTPTADAYVGSVASNGNGYAVVWYDWRNGNGDIYATLLDAAGNVTQHDIPIAVAAGDQANPFVVWSQSSSRWVIAWEDPRNLVSRSEIYTATLENNGTVHANSGPVITGAGTCTRPRLVDSGAGIGMAWVDTRDGNNEIYFGVLNGTDATRYSGPNRLTNDVYNSNTPVTLWTGAEYGVFWLDNRATAGGGSDVWFQRATSGGAAVGSNYQVSSGVPVRYLAAAFARHGYMAAYNAYPSTTLLQPWGCSSAASVPACPDGLNAYNISTSGDTLGWLPVNDSYTDIAYYRVFRNATLVGTTDNAYFSDTGLSGNVSYQYDVQTVNAAGNPSGTCTNARIWVKTTAPLSLAVAKTGPDIGLSWGGDAQSTYRVLRGTSPQALAEIQRTTATSTTDAGAAQGTTCWFYSIDLPQ